MKGAEEVTSGNLINISLLSRGRGGREEEDAFNGRGGGSIVDSYSTKEMMDEKRDEQPAHCNHLNLQGGFFSFFCDRLKDPLCLLDIVL